MRKGTISALAVVTGGLIGAGIVGKTGAGKVKEIQAVSDKHLALFLTMNHWMKIKQDGKNLSSYFNKYGYKKIAIYGMSYMGETLLNELRDSGIKISYGIDRKEIYTYIDVIPIDGPLSDVDIIVVTAITFFDEIREILCRKVTCPIVSLEDILYEVESYG